MIHYTYPNAHQLCIGCMEPMYFHVLAPAPLLKLGVKCSTANCPFYDQMYEVLPTLLKPFVPEEDSRIKLVTQ